MSERYKKIVFRLLLFFVIVFAATTYYFYSQLNAFRKTPQKATQEEIKDLVARVARLIVLPSGENPTVATVTDPEKLKGQPFFEQAKKGDKVLIYTNAKRAFLYDPGTDKIVAVAPFNIGSSESTNPQVPSESIKSNKK